METIESCSNFIDILEVNGFDKKRYTENFENMREYLFNCYRERESISAISLIKLLTQMNLMIEKFCSDNKDNKDDLNNLREYILLMLCEEKTKTNKGVSAQKFFEIE